MKAKRRFNIWLWVLLCVPCLLASCDHDVHDGEDEGGLSVSLTWADEADQGTEVKDVKLWIFNADDGSLVEEKHYGSAQEVASQRFALPEGHYQILATTNLIEPFFTTDQTRALTNWNNIQIGLTNPKDVKHNAYFGVAHVRIDNKEGNCGTTLSPSAQATPAARVFTLIPPVNCTATLSFWVEGAVYSVLHETIAPAKSARAKNLVIFFIL